MDVIYFASLTGEFEMVENATIPLYDKYGFVVSDKSIFKHHHYDEMVNFMKQLNREYPQISRLHSIGKSVQGRDLYVFVISSTPEKHIPGR